MKLKKVVSLLIMSLLFFLFMFCGKQVIAQSTYTVKEGDSLSKIAKKIYKGTFHWSELYEFNKSIIKDADKIEPGWVLSIPSKDALKKIVRKFSDDTNIRLVTGNNYPPYTGNDLPSDGMITEIVKKIFSEFDKKTEIKFWSWKFGYDACIEGKFDATFPYIKTPEREKLFYYSDSIYSIIVNGYVKKGSGINYETNNDLRNKKLCIPEGYSIGDCENELKGIAKIIRPKEMKDCFDLLVKGDVEIVASNSGEAEVLMTKQYGDRNHFVSLDKPFSKLELHLIIPKNNEKFYKYLLEFNQKLRKMKRDGELAKIIQRHLLYFNALTQ